MEVGSQVWESKPGRKGLSGVQDKRQEGELQHLA